MKKVFFGFLNDLWPIAIILVLVCIFFYPVFRGLVPLPADFVVGVYFPWLDYKWGYEVGVPVKNPMTTDVVSFMFPMQMLAIDMLKSGQWPLWNPYILAGTPLLANFQSAPFSPTNIVYWLTDRLTAWSIQIMLQHFLAALFTYFLLRWWKVSKLPSVLGGIIYAFAGFNLIWSQWNGHTLTAAFIPLLLLFGDLWLQKNKPLYGVGFAVTLALQIFSGYPQVVMYSSIAVALLWLLRIRSLKRKIFSTILLSIFGLIGLGLSAPQLLPGAELISNSQRAVEDHPYEWAFLPWSKVITFVAPDYYGNHATQNYWGPQDYTSNTGFVGVVSLMLASASLVLIRSNRKVLFSTLLLALSLLLAFPTPLSIFIWKSGVAGLQAASAHRALILFNLSVAILAGFGLDHLLKIRTRKQIILALLPVVILISFGTFALLNYLPQKDTPMPSSIGELKLSAYRFKISLRNLVIPTIVFISAFLSIGILTRVRIKIVPTILPSVLILFYVVEAYYFGWKFTPFTPRHIAYPQTPVLDFRQNQQKPFRVTGNTVIPMNMRMPYKIESPEGYDAVYSVIIAKFLARLNDNSQETSFTGRYGFVDRPDSRLADLLNTKYLLAIKRDQEGKPSYTGEVPIFLQEPKYKLVFEDKSVAVMENLKSLPRTKMYYDWEVIPEEKPALYKLLKEDFNISNAIVLEEEPDLVKINSREKAENSAEYKQYKDQSSLINVETKEDGMLFVSDSFYPGWKAFVDGNETKIYQANYAFRAVMVPKGEHEVKLVYQPESFFDGLKIAGVSALLLLVLFGSFAARWKTSEQNIY